jgi:transposase
MRAYSTDLRERVIAALQEGELSQPQIAQAFKISLGTVENWWRRWRHTGNLAPTATTPGPERTLKPCTETIRTLVRQQPDATLQELCAAVKAQQQIQASPSMMSRELKHLALPRKKVSARQSARNRTRPNVTRRTSRQNGRHLAPDRHTPEIHR